MNIKRLFRQNQNVNIIYPALFISALLQIGLLILYPPAQTAIPMLNTEYRVIRLVDLQETPTRTKDSPALAEIREIQLADRQKARPATARPLVRAEEDSSPRGTGEFYSQFTIDELPRITREAPKIYPVQARDKGKEGRVVLDIYIDAAGRIADIRIIHDPGYGLAQAALDYVRDSLWEPAKYQGRSVPVRIRKPIVFRLNE
jgi:TonB family protein